MSTLEQFKKEKSFDQRLAEAEKILAAHPDRVPVLVFTTSSWKHEDLPPLDKNKYLVPRDLTVGQFNYVIRKRIKLAPEKALFMFVGDGVLPPTSALMSKVYDDNKEPEKFLVCQIQGENTFGLFC